jgi:hypothetical protein
MQHNFTQRQLNQNGLSKWAIFLPAISGFYATFIGRQRVENYVDPARMPAGLHDMEQLNWLNNQKSMFPYKWSLYSAGHANLDLTKSDPSEDMVRNRESGSFMLGDSGGFQIAKGRWPGEWRAPNSNEVAAHIANLAALGTQTQINKKGRTKTIDPVAEYQKSLKDTEQRRRSVLTWLDTIADYSMTLDIPTWVIHDKAAGQACGITTLKEAIDATRYNNEYFINNRRGIENGGTRILNVLQGDNHDSAEDWYQTMKGYCDPQQYPGRHFDGWAMGGQNMCDVHLVLKRLVNIIYDGLLVPGVHDWMHFLGTSKLEWACLLTDIQNSVRKYHNPRFSISFDCASPFLATANGQLYTHNKCQHRSKWVYRMEPTADDKKYKTDQRAFRDVVLQDGIHDTFDDSPVSKLLKISDICVYGPTDKNKLGNIGNTSWDSFSYALLMSHNVWHHINAVQTANQQYENGLMPLMLSGKTDEQFDFRSIVDDVFSQKTRQKSLERISYYESCFDLIIGTRGFTGKRLMRPNQSVFNSLFEAENPDELESPEQEQTQFDETLLEVLENQ